MKLTHEQQVEQRIDEMKRAELVTILMTAKGSTQAAADRVSIAVLRTALHMCILIGRVLPEQVVPLSAKKGKQECNAPIAATKARRRRRSH